MTGSTFHLILATILLLLTPSVLLGSASNDHTTPKVLIVNSYNFGYDWSDQEMAGFKTGISQQFPKTDTYIETLDTKKFHFKNHFPQLAELFRNKYQDLSFDAVIAMDNAAMEFTTQYRDTLFPGTPILFCGINNYQAEMIANQSPITGVAEQHDLTGTIDLALKLQPQTKAVVVVHDFTDTGLAMKQQLQAIIGQFPQVQFHFFAEQPLEETLTTLKSLEPGQIVMVLSYTVEKSGRTFTQADTARLLSQSSPVPVYAVHQEQLGHGVVGGMMLSGRVQGERVAALLSQVLRGENPDNLAVITTGIARPAFDAKILDRFQLKLSGLPANTELINLPHPFYTIDKKTFWATLGTLALLTLMLLVMLRNIYRRKQLEQHLRMSEERFRILIEQAPEAIVVYDAESEALIECNAKAAELFSCSKENLLKTGLQDFFEKEQPDGLPVAESRKHYFTQALAGKEVQFQRAIRDSQGNHHFCEALLVHLPYKGQQWLRESFIDITERKNLENQLRQAEKMESIGKLAGGIAHDFNNQLASILGYTEMLSKRLESSQLQRYASYVKTAAERSAELIQQLLDFSRKGQQLSIPVDINGLIDEVIAILARSIDKRIRIRKLLNAGPIKILGDPTQLQNALLNLSINARDAMPDGGELIFETEVTTLGEEFRKRHNYKVAPGTYLKVSTTDTGYGMDKATRERVFEPFFTTKAMGKGTGMGLASVYGAVLSHKGHINVYSEPQKGSSFHLYLPMSEDLEDSPELFQKTEPIKGTGHILVIDDEELVRQMTCEMLEDLGYRVTECSNGMEAIDLYRSSWQQIDMALIDMTMPKMDGQETCLELHKINPALRAALCSGYSLNSNAQNYLTSGFSDFISKPFSSQVLSEKISKILEN